MARPKKSEERDTRSIILERALELFAERGFFGSSMRDVAKAVGIRQSALYHYFPSKDAMLASLLDELGPGQALRFEEIDFGMLADTVGARALLNQLINVIFAAWSLPKEQKFFRLLMREGIRLNAEGVIQPAALFARVRRLVERMFETLMRKKLIRKVDPGATAIGLIGPLMALRISILVMARGEPDLHHLRREIDRYMDFLWGSIKPLNEQKPRKLVK